MNAAIVAQLLTLGVQLDARRLVRGNVLRYFPLEDEGADVTDSEGSVQPGELPPSLFRELNGYGVSRHDVAVNGIKHKGDLPHKYSGALLRMDAGRTFSTDSSASLHRSPVWSLFLTSGLPGSALAMGFCCSLVYSIRRCARPSSFPGSRGWPPHGYNDSGLKGI